MRFVPGAEGTHGVEATALPLRVRVPHGEDEARGVKRAGAGHGPAGPSLEHLGLPWRQTTRRAERGKGAGEVWH